MSFIKYIYNTLVKPPTYVPMYESYNSKIFIFQKGDIYMIFGYFNVI